MKSHDAAEKQIAKLRENSDSADDQRLCNFLLDIIVNTKYQNICSSNRLGIILDKICVTNQMVKFSNAKLLKWIMDSGYHMVITMLCNKNR